MATITTSAAPTNSSLATFKAWAQAISSAFATFGWIQTADTGQVDWTAIVAPPGANTGVYEIWRMNDPLQSTMPVFVKIEYGAGSSANNPIIYITLGRGSNGSGTLTNITTRYSINSNTTGTASNVSLYDMNFSGAPNRFSMLIWRGYSYVTMLNIERSKNAAGMDTDEYVFVCSVGYTASTLAHYYQQLLPKTGAAFGQEVRPTEITQPATSPSNTSNTSTFNGKNAISPVFPWYGYFDNPLTGLIGLKAVDYVDGTVFSANLYGQSRLFMACTSYARGGSAIVSSNAGFSGGAFGIRFD